MSSKSWKYWIKRPIKMMKGVIGWKLDEQVPAWSIFGVMFDFTIIIFVLLNLTRTIGIIKVHGSFSELRVGVFTILIGSFFYGVGLMSSIFLILFTLKKVLRK